MGIHLCRRFVCMAFLGLALGARDDLALMVSPVPDSTTSTSLRFWLTALNESDEPMAWQPPAEFHCSVTFSNRSAAVLAHRVGAAESAVLAPGTFARVQYDLSLPAARPGEVTVHVREIPGELMTFHIRGTDEAGVEAPPRRGLVYFLRGRGHAATARDYDPDLFFKEHIFGHEPLYFIAGTDSPNAKFQISFKYRLLNEHGWLAEQAPILGGLYLAYSQTSLWDLNARSAPFFDSSYRPELLFSRDAVFRSDNGLFTLRLQAGVQHESNGRSGGDSRSLNIVYARPRLTIGRDTGLQLSLSPRAWVYVGDLSDNPDIEDYRGYADLRAAIGWKRGLQVSALARIGDDWNHGSATIDATYPLMQPPYGALSLYLHAQYFVGYGESLIGYRDRTEQFRAGISLYR